MKTQTNSFRISLNIATSLFKIPENKTITIRRAGKLNQFILNKPTAEQIQVLF